MASWRCVKLAAVLRHVHQHAYHISWSGLLWPLAADPTSFYYLVVLHKFGSQFNNHTAHWLRSGMQ